MNLRWTFVGRNHEVSMQVINNGACLSLLPWERLRSALYTPSAEYAYYQVVYCEAVGAHRSSKQSSSFNSSV